MGFLTKIWEAVFDTDVFNTPVHTVSPVHEWPTMRPIMRPVPEWPTRRPITRTPLGTHWISKPPDIKTEPPSVAVVARQSPLAFSLEKVLWVFLSGFGVLLLIAIFMKLGRPIRRVRRQLSSVRPEQNDAITTTNFRPGDGNLDMASLLRLDEDLPPPYSECVRSIDQCDVEEPPPHFSACFSDPKDTKPQVHLRRQNDLIETGQRVESVPLKDNNVGTGMRTERLFDDDSIVSLKKDLHCNNNDTGRSSQ